MLSTPLVTNCVLRLLVSVPADGPPISPLLTFSAPLWCSCWHREHTALIFEFFFSLLLQQTTSGHKNGPCDLMDHFIYLVFLTGTTHVWQAAGGMSAWLLLSLFFMFLWLSRWNTICTLSAGNDREVPLISLVVYCFCFVLFPPGGSGRLKSLTCVFHSCLR